MDEELNSFLYDNIDNDKIIDIEPIESIKPKVKKELTIADLDKRMEDKVRGIKVNLTRKVNQLALPEEKRDKKIKPITEKDIEARIYLWMLDGYTTKRIVDELFKIGIKTEHTAYKLIGNVNRSCAAVSKKDLDELRVRYIEMYSDLYTKAIAKKDYATARNILDSVVKLQGLIVKKVEGKVVDNFTVEF